MVVTVQKRCVLSEKEISHFVSDKNALIAELVVRNIVYSKWVCNYGVEHAPSVRCRRFVCRCSGRRVTRSIFVSSLFSTLKLPVEVVFTIAYDWLCSLGITRVAQRRSVSRTTVSTYFRYFRQLVAKDNEITRRMFGGYGVTVQVDEMFLASRQVWILGAVEAETRSVSLFVVENREAATILACLQTVVTPGTRLVTEALASYVPVAKELHCVHHVVNKSLQYVNPSLRVHTNNVEAMWRVLRAFLSCKSNMDLGALIEEFVWRQNNKSGLWSAYMSALSKVDYND